MNKYSKISDDEALDWIYDLRDFLPDDIKKVMDDYTAILRKAFISHLCAGDAVASIVNKIMAKQYPEIKDSRFTEIVFHSSDYGFRFLDRFPLVIQKLIHDQESGLNLRRIYPKFHAVAASVALMPKPDLLNEDDHKKYPKLTLAQWQKKLSKHNAEAMKRFNFEQKHKKQFMDHVKKGLLKYFPGIQNFGADEMVFYNNLLNDFYRVYKKSCDIEVRKIDYGLQHEGYTIGEYEADLAKKIKLLPKEKQAEGRAKQKLRLLG